MKFIGILVAILGLTWALIAINTDTTVTTESQFIGNIYIPSQQVHNIGKMDQRRNHLLLGTFVALTGVILFIFGMTRSPSNNNQTEEQASTQTKKCPFCAEQIKKEATICRFCQKELPPPKSQEETSKKFSKEDEKETLANPELITAIKRGSLNSVLAFLDTGIPAYGVDEEGHLIMELAEKTKDKLMIEILEKHRNAIIY